MFFNLVLWNNKMARMDQCKLQQKGRIFSLFIRGTYCLDNVGGGLNWK